MNFAKQEDSIFQSDFNPDLSVMSTNDISAPTDSFDSLTKSKYLFPFDKLTAKEWFQELQKPINVTVPDIMRDFAKFVKDFPVGIIPHQSAEESSAKAERKQFILGNNKD